MILFFKVLKTLIKRHIKNKKALICRDVRALGAEEAGDQITR